PIVRCDPQRAPRSAGARPRRPARGDLAEPLVLGDGRGRCGSGRRCGCAHGGGAQRARSLATLVLMTRRLIAVLALVCGCARTNTVAIEYLGTRDGPLGFTCSDGVNPLANRILNADHGCLVLDAYLPLFDGSSSDIPSCVSF